MKIHKRNKKIYAIMLTVSCLLLVAVGIQISIMYWFNHRDMERTAVLLLDRIVDVIERNEYTEKEMLEAQKADYISRAKTVSYILDAKPELEEQVEELKKIAALVSVDEIHLFRPDGVIYGGTLPQYYGYSFASGSQMKDFHEMLADHSLVMCQDLTPNTAEGKKMMYAMVWNEAGTRMVQVGIHPLRLLKELRQNEISEIVRRMPTYEGMQILVAEAATGRIEGATEPGRIGKTLDDIGILRKETSGGLQRGHVFIDGVEYIASFTFVGPYTVGVVQSVAVLERQQQIASILVAVYLGFATLVIVYMLWKVLLTREQRDAQFNILLSVAKIYTSMHLIHLADDTYQDYSFYTDLPKKQQIMPNAETKLYQFMEKQTLREQWDTVRQAIDLKTIVSRMEGQRSFSFNYINSNGRWCRGGFIVIQQGQDGSPISLLFTTRDIDDEKRREEKLVNDSRTDVLTQCLNRRAYVEDRRNGESFLNVHPFLYVSMDVNGLKQVNDTLGHEAGDELLQGAAACMKQCFGNYGHVYRMGGDEFCALLIADRTQTADLEKTFAETVKHWCGKKVQEMTIACGFVYSEPLNGADFSKIEEEGDRRMYEAKYRYYEAQGYTR